MGINVIMRGIITIFMIGIIFLGLMPTVYNLSVDESMWGDVQDSRALFLRDNAMLIFYISGLIGFFATIAWMFNASSSRGAVSQYG